MDNVDILHETPVYARACAQFYPWRGQTFAFLGGNGAIRPSRRIRMRIRCIFMQTPFFGTGENVGIRRWKTRELAGDGILSRLLGIVDYFFGTRIRRGTVLSCAKKGPKNHLKII